MALITISMMIEVHLLNDKLIVLRDGNCFLIVSSVNE
jgi:hypothetical protein